MPIINTIGGGSARGFGGVGGGAAPPPENTLLPSISGTAYVGQTLNINKGTWTALGPLSFEYQWYSATNGSIGGATSNTFTITSSELSEKIYAEVTATALGASTTAQTGNTAIVISFGDEIYTNAGSFTLTATGDTFGAVAVGSGGNGSTSTWGPGGAGGGLAYRNFATTSGQTVNINIDETPGTGYSRVCLGTTQCVASNSGGVGSADGACVAGAGGGNGGFGGSGDGGVQGRRGGGGGAGGYSGNGGNGGQYQGGGQAGSGGAGGGAGAGVWSVCGGGGVGIYGAGPSGTGAGVGQPGVGGSSCRGTGNDGSGRSGGNYGGGGSTLGPGGSGAVRIIWGGSRSFPNSAGV